MIRALLAVCAVLTILGGIQTYRVERLKTEVSVMRGERDAALKLATATTEVARADASTQAAQCQARVAEARLSAQRIETIIERPIHVDPQGCAVRELVSSDELRNALTPADPAQPLH